MCVSTGKANLTSTKTGVLVNYNKKTHTLFYQNSAQNLEPGGNCMILPILGSVSPTGIKDTRGFNKFLDNIVAQTKIELKSFGNARSAGGSKGITIKEVGAYTVVHAKGASAEDIQEALSLVPDNKRPTISTELIQWYKTFYNNPELLLCCFNSAEMTEVQPLMVEYKPRNFNYFIIPGADSHDGKVPRMGETTDRDHALVWGVVGKATGWSKVKFDQELVPNTLKKATWTSLVTETEGINSDWLCKVNADGSIKELPNVTTADHIARYFN